MRAPGLAIAAIACLTLSACRSTLDDCGQELCVRRSLTTCEVTDGVSTGYGLMGLRVSRPKDAPSGMQMYTLKVTSHTGRGAHTLIDRQANVTETTPFVLPLRYNTLLRIEARTVGGDGKAFDYDLQAPSCS